MLTSAALILYIYYLLSLVSVTEAAGESVLYELKDQTAVYLYGYKEPSCATPSPNFPNWFAVEQSTEQTPTFCSHFKQTYSDMKTDAIIRVNLTAIKDDPYKWCGKEAQLIDSSGKSITSVDGPLSVWDGYFNEPCPEEADCYHGPAVDVSAEVLVNLTVGNCAIGTRPGVTVKILDNDIYPPKSSGSQTEKPAT